MAKLGWSWGGIVLELEDNEVQLVLDAWDKVDQLRRLIPGIDSKTAAVVSLYFWVYRNWILWAKSFGTGIYLTLPWAAIWYGQYWLIWVWPR
jgi:hypothetical protein